MFRTLSLVAMRQEHRQRAQAAPLRLAGADELVDDHLRAVGKVAELRFPDHQRVRVCGRIAVFESHNRLFGQQGIDDTK